MDANNPKRRELTEKSPNQSKGSNHKGRSCKGTLYYSKALKSKNYSPFCVGIPRKILVPKPVVAEIEVDAAKDNRRLAEFRYVCAGYSMYLDRIKDKSSQTEPSELPLCSGLELLVGRKAPNQAPAAAPVAAHVHHKDDDREVPKIQKHKPTPKPAPDVPGLVFLNRFSRNADIVASGVSKNIGKVGNFIKARLYNIVYPK